MKQTISDKKSEKTIKKYSKNYFESPFTDFFINYKVNVVDDYIQLHKVIEINYDEFPKDLQRVYDDNEDSTKLILTGIEEAFNQRAGSVAFDKAN